MFFDGFPARELGSFTSDEVKQALQLVEKTNHFVKRSIHVMRDAEVMKALTPSNFDRPPLEVARELHDGLLPLIQRFIQDGEQLIYLDVSKLPAHKSVDLHVDWALMHVHSRRIHVPLVTDIFCRMGFITQDDMPVVHLERGVVYEVNNHVPHAVHNMSHTDRVHILFDVMDRDVFEMLVKKKLLLKDAFGSVTNRCFGEYVKSMLYKRLGRSS